jgi:hypothetical protein
LARSPASTEAQNCSAVASRRMTSTMRLAPVLAIADCAVLALRGRYRPAT